MVTANPKLILLKQITTKPTYQSAIVINEFAEGLHAALDIKKKLVSLFCYFHS